MYCLKCPVRVTANGCAECAAAGAPVRLPPRTDFSISGLMSPAPPHHAHLLATDAYLLSAYFLKLGYYQPAGPLIKEARDDMGGGYGAGAASGPPPQPFQPPYHAAPQQQPQPQPQHQLVHAVAGYGVGQYFPPELCFSRYYGRPPAYPPPPPPPQAPPQAPQDPQMMSPYYPAHCYHQSPPHRPMPYIPEAFRGGPAGGPPCPCPMRTCPKNVITGPAVGASGSAEEAGAAGGKASPAPALAPLAPAVKREAEPPPREVSFSPKKAGVAPDEPVDLKVENVSDADASPLHRPQSPLKSTPLPEPSLPQITPILQTLLPPNGISEHVKLQKRQKLIDKSQLETVKVPKLTDKVKGIKKKKSLSPLKPKTAVKKTTVIPVELTTTTLDITNEVGKNTSNLTKIDLPPTTETSCQINISPTKNGFDVMKHSTEVKQLTVPPAVSLPLPSIEPAKKAINKRKNGLSEPILESVAKKKKLTDVNERNPELKLALARPKNKSALLLDKLIKKNSIDRVIESVVKEASMDRCDLLNKTSARRKSAEGKRRKSISSDKCMKTPPVGIPMEIAKKGRKGIKSTSPKWSNGWSWQGEPYYAKVYINSAGTWGVRTCWPSMWHAGGAAGVRRGDAVLLRASSRGAAPFVARVAHLWRDHDGEMMLSLVWYYRPEHTERGRQDDDAPDEVFASRHRDSNSVACIDDKCYVLTYNEYCRYRKLVRASEQGITLGRSIVPPIPRMQTHPASSVRYPRLLPPLDISSDRVLFCRKVYDYRLKKIIKTPPC